MTFEDINFKIAVINELHNLGYYNEEAQAIKAKHMQGMGRQPIDEVLEYYTELDIDESLLPLIEELQPRKFSKCFYYMMVDTDDEPIYVHNNESISSIEGIEELVNLKKFNVLGPDPEYGPEIDYAPLLACPRLEYVNLAFMQEEGGSAIVSELMKRGVTLAYEPKWRPEQELTDEYWIEACWFFGETKELLDEWLQHDPQNAYALNKMDELYREKAAGIEKFPDELTEALWDVKFKVKLTGSWWSFDTEKKAFVAAARWIRTYWLLPEKPADAWLLMVRKCLSATNIYNISDWASPYLGILLSYSREKAQLVDEVCKGLAAIIEEHDKSPEIISNITHLVAGACEGPTLIMAPVFDMLTAYYRQVNGATVDGNEQLLRGLNDMMMGSSRDVEKPGPAPQKMNEFIWLAFNIMHRKDDGFQSGLSDDPHIKYGRLTLPGFSLPAPEMLLQRGNELYDTYKPEAYLCYTVNILLNGLNAGGAIISTLKHPGGNIRNEHGVSLMQNALEFLLPLKESHEMVGAYVGQMKLDDDHVWVLQQAMQDQYNWRDNPINKYICTHVCNLDEHGEGQMELRRMCVKFGLYPKTVLPASEQLKVPKALPADPDAFFALQRLLKVPLSEFRFNKGTKKADKAWPADVLAIYQKMDGSGNGAFIGKEYMASKKKWITDEIAEINARPGAKAAYDGNQHLDPGKYVHDQIIPIGDLGQELLFIDPASVSVSGRSPVLRFNFNTGQLTFEANSISEYLSAALIATYLRLNGNDAELEALVTGREKGFGTGATKQAEPVVAVAAAAPIVFEGDAVAGKTFLFTGTLSHLKRSAAEGMVKEKGGTVLSKVGPKLNYLVTGADTGQKLADAQKLGTVKILSENEFMLLMGIEPPAALRVFEIHWAEDNENAGKGWAYGTAPGIRPTQWPRDNKNGLPLGHLFTLYLPKEYRVKGAQYCAISVFYTDSATVINTAKAVIKSGTVPEKTGENNGFLEAVAAHVKDRHPMQVHMPDEMNGEWMMLWLTKEEFEGTPISAPEDGREQYDELDDMPQWCAYYKDQDTEYVDYTERWEEDFSNMAHIGGECKSVQDDDMAFGPYCIEFNEELGDIYQWADGRAQLDLSAEELTWACT